MANEYEKIMEKQCERGFDAYSPTWSVERGNIDNCIRRVNSHTNLITANSKNASEYTNGRAQYMPSDHKKSVIQLLRHKNELLYKEKTVLHILKRIQSPIVIDKLELYCEEIQEAIRKINESLESNRNVLNSIHQNYYLTENERSQAKKNLIKTIFESIVYYLTRATHDEKAIIKQMLLDGNEVINDEDGVNTSSFNQDLVRRYMIENLALTESNKHCFYCNTKLLQGIDYCFNCYERNEE
jgi:hypothetical protein